MPIKRNAFISYRHWGHRVHKQTIQSWNETHDIFNDRSVNSGDISDSLSDESIRRKIRDESLGGSSVTILLYGSLVGSRKFIDWEMSGSMASTSGNGENGILIVDLTNSYTHIPSGFGSGAHAETVGTKKYYRASWENIFPDMPDRIVDNLIKTNVSIPIVKYSDFISYPGSTKGLIEKVGQKRFNNIYDNSRRLRRKNG